MHHLVEELGDDFLPVLTEGSVDRRELLVRDLV